MSAPVRVVVISEEARERERRVRVLNATPGVEVTAQVDQVCDMRKQAGHIDADCVVLDIDRYPLAGTLGLAQARATFPDARIIVLTRSIPPRYLQFLRESGASCCIDKDDPMHRTWLMQAIGGLGTISHVRSSAASQSTRRTGGRALAPAEILA